MVEERRKAWQVLEAAGVPIGPVRPMPASILDPGAVVTALDVLANDPDDLDFAEREALLAWLSALHDHFPALWKRALQPAAGRLRRSAARGAVDASRHIKLRRIALATLVRIA